MIEISRNVFFLTYFIVCQKIFLGFLNPFKKANQFLKPRGNVMLVLNVASERVLFAFI